MSGMGGIREAARAPGGGGNSGMASFDRLEGKIDGLADEVQEVKVLLAAMMPRAEVDAELARRVALEVYSSDQRATNERLIRLEASPARLLAWLSGGVGCMGVLLSMAALAFVVLEFTLNHYRP